jgi:predicted AlkP superfamily pyrophosphatase or phosphodiesterase
MRLRTRLTCALLLFVVFAASPALRAQAPAASRPATAVRHVIIVSVDGLMPETYLSPDSHGLRIPTLRELAKNGAAADGAVSVLPTVTYPSHTSMVTGAHPARHGIANNLAFDPLERNQQGWRWYSEDIRVPTLWALARARGLRTALINWPVTLGARADWIVPEFWRAGTPEDSKLTRALSTPGLLDAVVRRFPDFWQRYSPPSVKDSAGTDIAVHIIEAHRPNLLLLHLLQTDSAQHEFGPWSPEAIAAIENADAQIARLIASAKKAGIWPQTALVVASDHGFLRYTQRVRPGIWLREKGLVTLDARNRLTDWKACVQTATGTAFFYLKDPNDTATRRALEEIIAEQARKPDTTIARVLSQQEIAAAGGDSDAVLAIVSRDGFAFTGGYTGELISPATGAAGHGWPPDRPEMLASLLFYGPAITPGRISSARLVDVAPTVASWLGLPLKAPDGKPLPVRLRSSARR